MGARVLPLQARRTGENDAVEVARLAGLAAREAREVAGLSLGEAAQRANLALGCTVIWPELVGLWERGAERPDVVQWLAMVAQAPPADAIRIVTDLVSNLAG